MDYNTLKLYNYELFLDGVSEGVIPYSYIDGVLEVGPNQPNPFVTSFVGGPHLPETYRLPKNLAGMSYGASGFYSKPFLSLGQRYNNGVYSNVGAYAKLVRYQKPNYSTTCINDNCEKIQATSKEIWGRVGTIVAGAYAGQLGFFIQNWYNHDDGQYDAAFWADRYNLEIPDKKTWWDQCTKVTVQARFYNDPLREICEVEVAVGNTSYDDDQYFRGEDISSLQDASLELLPVITALVSAVGWI